MKFHEYPLSLRVNALPISRVRIGRHFETKHSSYMNDALILELVMALDGKFFREDSTTDGVSYYVADIAHSNDLGLKKIYRLIWVFEGDSLEILGIVNAYRRKKRK